jgi:hypothetical protein
VKKLAIIEVEKGSKGKRMSQMIRFSLNNLLIPASEEMHGDTKIANNNRHSRFHSTDP